MIDMSVAVNRIVEAVKDKTFIDLFMSRSKKNGDCLEWTSHKYKSGYGLIQYKGINLRAHRVAFYLKNGFLPKYPDLVIDHICCNKPCVKADHLRAITIRENSLRGERSVSAIAIRKTHCLRGHELSGDNLFPGPLLKYRRRVCRKCSVILWKRADQKKREKLSQEKKA